MRRREFFALVGGAVAWPLAARAQPARRLLYRVGLCFTTAPVTEMVGADPIHPAARSFVHGLRALGYVEGHNLVLEHRSAEGKFERFPEIIRELVAINVDVIVTTANPMTRAAKEVTQIVPIVMVGGNPVEQGLVKSLSRPGGNVTGLTFNVGPEIPTKRLQLLKELLPRISQVAFLHSQEHLPEGIPSNDATGQLGIQLLLAEHTWTGYAEAFALIERQRADALLVSATSTNYGNRRLIVEFAARNRLPAMYPFREAVEVGGLMSYGASIPDLFRRLAGYVDRVLKGAAPGDLPVEQPTKFELVINLKTANALGITVPPSLLAVAEDVIE